MKKLINGFDNQKSIPSFESVLHHHAGSFVESIIRKKGHNISKLARYMKISRCTLYNWFEQDTLSFDVLIRIGSNINYDFSADFPEIFSSNFDYKLDNMPSPNQISENEKLDYWIKKYIKLLEKYNESLSNRNYIHESR